MRYADERRVQSSLRPISGQGKPYNARFPHKKRFGISATRSLNQRPKIVSRHEVREATHATVQKATGTIRSAHHTTNDSTQRLPLPAHSHQPVANSVNANLELSEIPHPHSPSRTSPTFTIERMRGSHNEHATIGRQRSVMAGTQSPHPNTHTSSHASPTRAPIVDEFHLLLAELAQTTIHGINELVLFSTQVGSLK